MRIARLNEVNRIPANGRRLLLADVSYACGYTDQAPFIRDFKHFTSESPKNFVRERDRFIVNPNAANLQTLMMEATSQCGSDGKKGIDTFRKFGKSSSG